MSLPHQPCMSLPNQPCMSLPHQPCKATFVVVVLPEVCKGAAMWEGDWRHSGGCDLILVWQISAMYCWYTQLCCTIVTLPHSNGVLYLTGTGDAKHYS